MAERDNDRDAVLEASRSAYGRVAELQDRIAQHSPDEQDRTARQLDFLEYAFRTYASRPVERILDIACGGGRHVVGLAKQGYRCTGRDLTPERVAVAQKRAKREGVSARFQIGNATDLRYDQEFDAVLAIDVLFLLPSDEDTEACLRQAHRALRGGGLLICTICNPLARPESEVGMILQGKAWVEEYDLPDFFVRWTEWLAEKDLGREVAWVEEKTEVREGGERYVFRERERIRFFTPEDFLGHLKVAGFRFTTCHPGWREEPREAPDAEMLVYVAQK